MLRLSALSLALVIGSVSAAAQTSGGEPAPLPDEVWSKQRYSCNVTVFPEIVVLGSFAHDRGCEFSAIIVGRKQFKDVAPATASALARLGWKRASGARRRQLAQAWTRRVIARFDDFQVSSHDGWAGYYEPSVKSQPDGSVVIKMWVDTTRVGMRQPEFRNFHETIIRFDARGRLAELKRGKSHQEPYR